jgi:OOP family OmpA-OmpF porin
MMKRSTLIMLVAFLVGLSNLQGQDATPTPQNMLEIGFNANHAFISGDVDYQPGYGAGLHIRKALDYVFSLRGDVQYALISGERDAADSTAFESTLLTGTIYGVISANSLRFNQSVKKVDMYAMVGIGGSYNRADVRVPPSRDFVEGSYTLIPHAAVGVGVSFRVSPRINIGLEHQSIIGFGGESDNYDGLDLTSGGAGGSLFRDVVHLTGLVVNVNIGDASRYSEPLYWVNPLENVMKDIADLKEGQTLSIEDTDGDGVIDAIDQEPNTPPDVPVDTKGRTLDSDRDGVPDYKDREPYFPPRPGERVDEEGIVVNPISTQGGGVSEDRVREIIAEELQNYQIRTDQTGGVTGGGGTPGGPGGPVGTAAVAEWFLPMIHFGTDASTVKYSDYGTLASIARMMKGNPGIRLVITGFADASAPESYNNELSYERAKSVVEHLVNNHGIGRGRLVLQWKGEAELLVPTGSSYMNRRVEFRVAQPNDVEMDPPSGGSKSSDGY